MIGCWQPNPGQTSCIPCAPDFFANIRYWSTPRNAWPVSPKCNAGCTWISVCCSGQVSCHPCPRGQISLGNATLCTPCPTGRFQAAMQNSTCDACPMGWFANATGSTRCFTCGSGTFAPTINHTDCQLCPAGTYNINPDGLTPLTSCNPCPGGSYAPNGSSSCTKCPAGRYNNLTFQSECLLCPNQVQVRMTSPGQRLLESIPPLVFC